MFVAAEELREFTGRKRPSAQARFLSERGLKFTRRPDGLIALRQEELDSYTLSRTKVPKRHWEPDFSPLNGQMLE